MNVICKQSSAYSIYEYALRLFGGNDMEAPVWYQEQTVGTIWWIPDTMGVQVEVDCAQPVKMQLLRCYAQTDTDMMLIGLLAPEQGRLRLRRRFTRETLRQAGCLHVPPERFLLSDHKPEGQAEKKMRTGDSILDALLESGAIQAEQQGEKICLSCLFAPDQAFALAPAFALCSVQEGRAFLFWNKKSAASKGRACENITE